jgi:hypothetical protein
LVGKNSSWLALIKVVDINETQALLVLQVIQLRIHVSCKVLRALNFYFYFLLCHCGFPILGIYFNQGRLTDLRSGSEKEVRELSASN